MIMPGSKSSSKSSMNSDDNLRSSSEAQDFFRKRNRVRTVDLKEANNARTLSWNSEGTMIGVGCENRAVYVGALDQHYCRIRNVYVGYGEGQIESLKFAHTNPRLFSTCSTDKTVRIWDTNVSKTHRRIESKEANYYVIWSPDDLYIVSIARSNNTTIISAIDVRTENVHYKAVLKEELFEPAFHPNGKFLFLTSENGKLIVLEFPSMQRYKTIQAHPPLSECQSIDVSPDGRLLAIGASDACCSVWNISDMMCVKMIDRLDYPIQSLSFSKCSNLLAQGSEDNFIDIGWVRDTNEKIVEVSLQSQCFDVKWNPKLYLLAYATAPSENDHREPYSVRLFGCSGEIRRT